MGRSMGGVVRWFDLRVGRGEQRVWGRVIDRDLGAAGGLGRGAMARGDRRDGLQATELECGASQNE